MPFLSPNEWHQCSDQTSYQSYIVIHSRSDHLVVFLSEQDFLPAFQQKTREVGITLMYQWAQTQRTVDVGHLQFSFHNRISLHTQIRLKHLSKSPLSLLSFLVGGWENLRQTELKITLFHKCYGTSLTLSMRLMQLHRILRTIQNIHCARTILGHIK